MTAHRGNGIIPACRQEVADRIRPLGHSRVNDTSKNFSKKRIRFDQTHQGCPSKGDQHYRDPYKKRTHLIPGRAESDPGKFPFAKRAQFGGFEKFALRRVSYEPADKIHQDPKRT